MNDITAFTETYPWITAILLSVGSYLIGSVSSARIVFYLVTRRKKIEPFAEPVPHSDEIFESDIVSATLVSIKLGKKYGLMTSLADMLKVALPTLITKLLLTGEPYFLLVALFGVIGHNFPVYYGFRGGRGESSIMGIILVINWFGLIIANLAAAIAGFITGSVLVVRWGGYVILIFWLWFFFGDWRYGLFMALVNLAFWLSMSKDLARFVNLRKKGLVFTQEEISEFIMMGKKMGRMLDRHSLPALIKRALSRSGNKE